MSKQTLGGLLRGSEPLDSNLSDADYEFLTETVYRLSRISLGSHKKTMVSSRLIKRMRALNINKVSEYCEFLKKPGGRNELSNLIDTISTNHTYFFREAPHFEYLTTVILGRKEGRGKGIMKIWSSACSSGEEPYSMAMILEEQRRIEPGFDWRMEATDISSIALGKAQQGRYAEGAMIRVPDVLKPRYFQQSEDGYLVNPDLRKRIRFERLNLFAIPPAFPSTFDLIICRNVMIYFDRTTREELVNELGKRLVSGGHLFVGHSESLSGIQHDLIPVQPAIYRKG